MGFGFIVSRAHWRLLANRHMEEMGTGMKWPSSRSEYNRMRQAGRQAGARKQLKS